MFPDVLLNTFTSIITVYDSYTLPGSPFNGLGVAYYLANKLVIVSPDTRVNSIPAYSQADFMIFTLDLFNENYQWNGMLQKYTVTGINPPVAIAKGWNENQMIALSTTNNQSTTLNQLNIFDAETSTWTNVITSGDFPTNPYGFEAMSIVFDNDKLLVIIGADSWLLIKQPLIWNKLIQQTVVQVVTAGMSFTTDPSQNNTMVIVGGSTSSDKDWLPDSISGDLFRYTLVTPLAPTGNEITSSQILPSLRFDSNNPSELFSRINDPIQSVRFDDMVK